MREQGEKERRRKLREFSMHSGSPRLLLSL
jgi:hypothetical protein